MSLSEVAVQVLQEERWRGTSGQTIAFVKRLCAGRSSQLGESISNIRDAFESVDLDGNGEINTSVLGDVFRGANIPATKIDLPLKQLIERLDRQNR